MSNILDQELDKMELPNQGVKWVEYCSYTLGINVVPRKRSSRYCRFLRIVAYLLNFHIMCGLMNFVLENYTVSFQTNIEAMVLCFQIIMNIVKIVYYHNRLNVCADLMRISETCDVLKDLGIFDVGLTNKQVLCNALMTKIRESWKSINNQVMFFFKIVSLPVIFYCARPYVLYIYDCYLVRNSCNIISTYPAKMPFVQIGNHEYPSFTVRFFVEQAGPIYCFCNVFGFNSFFVVLTNHEACLFELLRYLVENSTNDEIVPKASRVAYLRCCAKLFGRLSRHRAQVENLFSSIILVQCGISTFFLCMLLYNIMEVDFSKLSTIVVYFLTILFEISLYNVNAQKVETQSELLFDEWYNCAWYNESEDFKLIIRLMLLFSMRTFKLSVGGFSKLSNKLLVQVFRLSGNFYLLLRNMNNK
ncbi:odorant receptor 67b [Drosophila navojoa]|uniref:odorant receptor 67b n=1 Tax=Drosophila navojoa TaxID=7232 RepID=UPI000846BF09|nr:odorant receptor 67b [Drosophila navojoa]